MILNSMTEWIGNTPTVYLAHHSKAIKREIYLKLEWFNPGGSVKDRIALSMIDAALAEGLLSPHQTVIEPTSGNTGIGLALVCAVKQHPLIITMPETVSIERRKILKGYGAQLILTPGDKGMKGAIAIAEDLQKKHGYFMPMQFDNLHNPKVHMRTTAQEILKDFSHLDAFVAGVGTGGTITGVGSILKEHFPSILLTAVEPFDSPVLSGKPPGPHKLTGIGAGFIPKILDTSLYQSIVSVKTEEAFETARNLMQKEGVFGGISTGANVFATLQIAQTLPEGSILLTVAPSNGERYLSTELFDNH